MSVLVIHGGGLSPSNRDAGFPNLARGNPSEQEIEAITETCKAELITAGIEPFVFSFVLSTSGEVPTKCGGSLSMWSFKRAWYYWVANGPGLPVEVAEKLHATHGRQVRVDGHCGCPSPREWFKGFGVGSYHVDSPEGLKALADAILSVYDARNDPDATPRNGGKSP